MAEKVENAKPVFKECSGGKQFFVTIPQDKRGKWMDEFNPAYNQGHKSYVFRTKDIRGVEIGLGLNEGESGIRDPGKYFSIVLEGEIKDESGFEALKESMKAKGFTWKSQTRQFVGPVSGYDSIKDKLAK